MRIVHPRQWGAKVSLVFIFGQQFISKRIQIWRLAHRVNGRVVISRLALYSAAAPRVAAVVNFARRFSSTNGGLFLFVAGELSLQR